MPNKTPLCPYGPTNTYTVATPIGEMVMTSCPRGVHSLETVEGLTDDNFCPDTRVTVSLLSQLYQDNGYTYKPALQCIRWLQSYFCCHGDGQRKEPALPKICTHVGKEGSFTYRAWFILQRKVPFGKSISYLALARLCGNDKACRAVGQAMRNNPVSLIIPCHRVIQENGGLGNYSGGSKNKVKEWLLRHEGFLK